MKMGWEYLKSYNQELEVKKMRKVNDLFHIRVKHM